ncbi:Protein STRICTOSIDINE SYNTHASE-LIKE 9 [Raphanus sativus]|uniref:Protein STRICTOSIDINE SYNTHASE-LIKE 9-like n=1 Tax=Raphanus sativus TaxID=3726 RepID=A0A6J0LER8_RAPSA|nr:protein STRICTOSIDINE SYNTHASE-LIKE 9-like [Raphanus sativus]KAJ4905048.1 Protein STRICTOSIDINE SYNTHASE-LIKE 9 [Raphanus sativus]
MPISEKIPTWAVVPATFAVFSVISYQILIAPDNLNGTKNVLSMAKTIPLPVDGPESIEWDPQGGGPYAAVVDGRILKWRGDGLGWVEFAYTSPHRGNCSRHEVVPTCGRPLGLSFEKKTGDLYICDGYFGVMKVGPEGGLAELVVDQVEGRKVMFANQMDIDEEEDVFYFNDSSDKYHFREVFYVTVNGERSGRVIRYNKKTKEAKVVMDNLRCNNGLALNKDRSFLISCESATGLVHRYWIKGPKAGTRDIFAKVPGYPDNIRLTPTGDFWIGIHCKKNLFGRLAVNNYQWLGKLVEKTVKLELLIGLVNGFKPHGVAVKISGETGEIVEILEDKEGKTMQYVSEAYERDDGKIWFGSVFKPAVWVLDRK